MRLRRISVSNYRTFVCFDTSVELFCAIVGQNNAGKTNLLHAIDLLLYRGTDRSLPLVREDFRRPDESMIIKGFFDQLDERDVQAFFSLEGSPGASELGIMLEAKWADGEIQTERWLIRADKDADSERVTRFTRRYSQFIRCAYVSPYRQPHQGSQIVRDVDYRTVLRTYVADYMEPLRSLLADAMRQCQEMQGELQQRGVCPMMAWDECNRLVERIRALVEGGPVADPSGRYDDSLESTRMKLEEEWGIKAQQLIGDMDELQKHVSGQITKDLVDRARVMTERVTKALQRIGVQLSLLRLRDSLSDSADFQAMTNALSWVLTALLPEAPPTLQPFPIQDDHLLSEVVVQLGEDDLLHSGSGFQNAFSLGLSMAGILADAAAGVIPRLVVVEVEEPEAHLHPQKQRHLLAALRSLQETLARDHDLCVQFIISTHSSNILSGMQFDEIIILRREGRISSATKLDYEQFLNSWMNDLGVGPQSPRHVRLRRLVERRIGDIVREYAETLFARYVLLLEGDAELGAFPIWARLLDEPNDLDRLGISVVLGNGSELPHTARIMDALGIDYLIVCDRGDQHDLAHVDPARICQTEEDDFEDEMLRSLPAYRILGCIAASIDDEQLQGLLKYMRSPKGIGGLSAEATWEDVVAAVRTLPDNKRLRSVIKDPQRRLLKGPRIGMLLADEAKDVSEIPAPYRKALEKARQRAMEIIRDE